MPSAWVAMASPVPLAPSATPLAPSATPLAPKLLSGVPLFTDPTVSGVAVNVPSAFVPCTVIVRPTLLSV